MVQTLEEINKAEAGKNYCINNPDGICLAIAGPGTGKTYAIANRIKTIIKNGCAQDRILCLTFTDTASKQMTKGIKEALANDNIEAANINVNVCTFHSFCMNIIKEYTDKFELAEGVKVIPDSVKRMFIAEITEEIQSEFLKTETGSRLLYIDPILSGIDDIKKYNYTKEQYYKNIENFDNEKDKLKAADLWKFYEKYEQRKQENNYIDYSDMIIMLTEKFKKDREFLKTIAESYDYILIDEYQDTNPLQNEIVYELGEYCDNIFAVGDDDQTIYSFQGAQITTMKEFINHFTKKGKEVKVVTFNGNRRSTKNIIDISRSIVLIQNSYSRFIVTKESFGSAKLSEKKKERALYYKPLFIPIEWDENFKDYKKEKISKELTAVNSNLQNNPVYCFEYEDEKAEQYSIIEKIKELKQTTPLNEIAILLKSNAELDEYAKLLKKNNIDYELKDGKNIFEIKSVDILISYLELLVNPDVFSGKFLSYLLSPVFHIHPEDYITIYKNRAHSNIIQTMDDILNNKLENKKFIEKDKIENFLNIYRGLNNAKDGLSDIKEGTTLEETVLLALNETGILEYFTSEIETGKVENLLGLKKFIEEAKGYQQINKNFNIGSNLAGFLKYIKQMQNDGVKICTDKPDYKLDAIQLSTYHSSKGREYKYVFMPSMNKNKWESRRGGGGIKINVPMEEDKILQNKMLELDELNEPQYIKDWLKAEGRMMELIKLIFVGITRAKEGLFLSYTESSNNASTFLKILKEDFENKKEQFVFVDENKTINTEEENISKLYSELNCKRYDYKKDFKELIQEELDKIRHFSPTSLNKWLKCRRRFLYENILDLGTDETQNGASYGTAVHRTFEEITKYLKETGSIPELSKIKEIFSKEMSTLNFDPMEINDIKEKGSKTLDNYYETMKTWDSKKLYAAEFSIDDFEIEGEKFSAKIDRIDKSENGNYIIYDYKTSSKPSKNELNPDGKSYDFFNQLAFYKYLFSKKENIELDKIKTILVFPKDSSEIEAETTAESCMEVKKRYFETINKLKNLDFEKAKDVDKSDACKYCSCKSFCSFDIN